MPRPVAPPSVTLVLVFDTGQRYQVAQGAAAVLGRAPTAQTPGDQALAVKDDEGTVSKNHLRIEHGRDGVWLTDLGSTNGTDLLADDGQPKPLPPRARTRLDPGARVRMGHRVFQVSRAIQGG